MARKGGGIDLSTLNVQKTPRTAREVAERKLRQELRAAGDAGASKKGGAERDEDLAEYYRKRNAEKLEAARAAKQKLLLANPTQSLVDCACGGPARLDDLAFLVSKGCDLDDMVRGMTPLMHACKYGGAGMMSTAAGGGAPGSGIGAGSSATSASSSPTQAGLEALVRAGADVDVQTETGQTALMIAVVYNNPSAVSFLLDHSGAKPELLDAAGHSALQCAYERGLTAIASKLVRALAAPPAKVTTVAKEKIAEAKKKALEARQQEARDKQAARDKIVQAALAVED